MSYNSSDSFLRPTISVKPKCRFRDRVLRGRRFSPENQQASSIQDSIQENIKSREDSGCQENLKFQEKLYLQKPECEDNLQRQCNTEGGNHLVLEGRFLTGSFNKDGVFDKSGVVSNRPNVHIRRVNKKPQQGSRHPQNCNVEDGPNPNNLTDLDRSSSFPPQLQMPYPKTVRSDAHFRLTERFDSQRQDVGKPQYFPKKDFGLRGGGGGGGGEGREAVEGMNSPNSVERLEDNVQDYNLQNRNLSRDGFQYKNDGNDEDCKWPWGNRTKRETVDVNGMFSYRSNTATGGGELMRLLARFEEAVDSSSESNEVNGRWCEAQKSVDTVMRGAELAKGEIEEAAKWLESVECCLKAAGQQETEFHTRTQKRGQLLYRKQEIAKHSHSSEGTTQQSFFLHDRISLTVEYVQHLLEQAENRLMTLQSEALRVKKAKEGFVDAVSRSDAVWLENVARASGELEALLRVILPMEFAFWTLPQPSEGKIE